ncbi:MAG: prolipoprotein diacylglyceryl transferase family protein [Myxococcota bacterium]
MYPDLLRDVRGWGIFKNLWFFEEPLPAYFTLLMVGFGLATYLSQRQARRIGLDHDTMIDLGLFALIWGVIGGRILHVIADGYFWDYVHLCTDPSQVEWQVTESRCAAIEGVWDGETCRPPGRDCFAWAAFWRGGLAYYGGLISAGIYGVHFLRKSGFPVMRGVDIAGSVIPLGLFFGRLGCFLGGCCFGSVCDADHALAVRFPAWSAASESQWKAGLLDAPTLESLPVYPAQLFEAFGCLLIFAFCVLWMRPRKRFDGQVMLSFIGLYAVLRFMLEFVRADDRGALLGLSTSQLIGVLGLALTALAWRRLASASPETSEG